MQFPGPQWPELETITLTDGRTLAFRRIGAKTGKPVLFFHGTPGSHTLGFMAGDAAERAGYQLICPDRPGIGDSAPQKGRELRHYPLDMIQLLAHLKIKECGVIGISGGAPYAFQCAYDLPNQITFVTSLSGWLSFGREEATGIKLPKPINTFRLMYKSKFTVPAVGKLTEYTVNKQPDKFVAHLRKTLPPADVALMDVDFYRELFLYDLQNAYKNGWKGPAVDGALQFGDQPFALHNIKQPVILLHGTADSVVPYAMAEAYNKHLPNVAEFITTPEGGHLCAATEEGKVFNAIKKIDT
ncbi:MAG: alpha/beta hydrolase [Rickettsiales bacterium]|nr:alpha/beta hydrolase [Rickettsiales bacterium]